MQSQTADNEAPATAEPRLWFRLVLWPLALVQAVNGAWAVIAPRSFYESFPFDRGWVEALPAFNEHLMRDVGGLFLMSAVILAAAATWLERRLVGVAIVAWLAFALPHTAYHLLNLGPYSTGDAVANVITLGATVALPMWLGWLLIRGGGGALRGSAGDDPGTRGRGGEPGPRIDPVPKTSRNPLVRMAYRHSRRRFGRVMDPLTLFAHHPRLMLGYGTLELATERSRRTPGRVKHLASMRAGMLAGCEWCLDFGSALSPEHGVDEADLEALLDHRRSDRFSRLEVLALDLADGMSRSPVSVSDELLAELREHLDDAQIVELVSEIALENYRARFNWAFGLEGQGFSAGSYCVPPASVAEGFGEGPRDGTQAPR